MFRQLNLWELVTGSKPSKRRINKRKNYDSDPHLKKLWDSIQKTWFPERTDLSAYEVLWSRRPQLRTLATCNMTDQRVLVARELNYPQHIHWLEPLLYHEMCHAVVGVTRRNGKNSYHGKEFKALERRHPKSRELNKWIQSGGWATAIRSDRSKRAAVQRKR